MAHLRLPSYSWILISCLCVLAPALGGSTAPGPQGVIVFFTGLLFFIAPVRRALGFQWNLGFALLLLPLAGAFLPSGWFPIPAWTKQLGDLGVISPTLSAQPWISAEATLVFFTGLCWAYYLLAYQWHPRERRQALSLYTGGITLLAGFALIVFYNGFSVPSWTAGGFGFFPNRNQSADVIALAGIMITGLLWGSSSQVFGGSSRPWLSTHSGSGGSGSGGSGSGGPGFGGPGSASSGLTNTLKNPAWRAFWFVALAILGAALVADTSRAGIVLFFAGSAATIFWAVTFARSKKMAGLCLAGLIFLLTGFFLFGGKALQRFEPASGPDSRLAIQADALAISQISPVLGVGLGNFEPVFAMNRERTVAQSRTIHPESDWLWAAIEIGWPAVIVILFGFGLWLKECQPFTPNSDRYLRATAVVAGICFAIHGLVDVSGHRVGSLWPALFLFSIALPPVSKTRPKVEIRWLKRVCQGLGVLLMVIGIGVVAAATPPLKGVIAGLPSQRLERLQEQIAAAQEVDGYESIVKLTTAAIEIAPLDWLFYHQRARAQASSLNSIEGAQRDFARVRLLEPKWPQIAWSEGEVWMSIDESQRALQAWKEALTRAELVAPAVDLYGQILGAAEGRPELFEALHPWAAGRLDYQLVYLKALPPGETQGEIESLLARDPTLLTYSDEQKAKLLEIWYNRGNRAQLNRLFEQHPNWQSFGWLWMSRDAVEHRDFERAFRLTHQFGPHPTVPEIVTQQPMADLERTFLHRPGDYFAGLTLFWVQRNAGQRPAALSTLQALAKIKVHPSYIEYLEAEIWAELGEWEKAWMHLAAYSAQNKP